MRDVRLAAFVGLKDRDYRVSPLRPNELTALVKASADADVAVRALVNRGLTTAKQTSAIIPALIDGLGSAREEVRWTSAEGLAVAGPGVAAHMPKLLAALEKANDNNARLPFILALGEAVDGAKAALPALFVLAGDKEPIVRRKAMRALMKAAAADPAEATKRMKAMAANTSLDDETRRLASAVIVEIGSTVGEIAERLKHPNLQAVFLTLPAINRLGDTEFRNDRYRSAASDWARATRALIRVQRLERSVAGAGTGRLPTSAVGAMFRMRARSSGFLSTSRIASLMQSSPARRPSEGNGISTFDLPW